MCGSCPPPSYAKLASNVDHPLLPKIVSGPTDSLRPPGQAEFRPTRASIDSSPAHTPLSISIVC